MWKCRSIIRCMKHTHARMVHTTYCSWGTPWKKDTSFMFWHNSTLSLIESSCHSSCGLCQYSGKKHQILAGNSPSGPAWTMIAQPYPQKLCNKIAFCAKVHFQQRFVNKLDRLMKWPCRGSPCLLCFILVRIVSPSIPSRVISSWGKVLTREV